LLAGLAVADADRGAVAGLALAVVARRRAAAGVAFAAAVRSF
jgi:hypothetical protein